MGMKRDKIFSPSKRMIPTIRWILEKFKERPRETASLEKAAVIEGMRLDERSYTRYVSDLKTHGLVITDSFGCYHPTSLGLQWLYTNRESKEKSQQAS